MWDNGDVWVSVNAWSAGDRYIAVNATTFGHDDYSLVEMTWQEAEQLAHAILEAVAELKKEPHD